MASGAKTVMPPQRSGPLSAKFSFSGNGMAHAHATGRDWRTRRDGRRSSLALPDKDDGFPTCTDDSACNCPEFQPTTDALSNAESLGIRTYGGDLTDDLMAENRRGM